ncbi:mevalonate kinase [Marine Group I thaumarchaeote]|uniref:mevalonate kinase n=1 Tax=Marine Group I thaumarchaeote TaxID=2511932 RepID=A0A7K4NTW2_9ARCH|nr:mevalonate kinase [Marine Group I thaumarchaeote]
MKSIASAPAKIILFGEHFVVHGTKAILAAIDKRVTVTSTFTNDNTIKVNSQLGTLEIPISSSYEEAKSEFRPFIFLANKMINSNQNVSGLEITIDSDIPIGVGLGSSSACCIAAAASISELFKKLSSEKILNLAIEAEKTIFPDTSGADCTVCTYGGMIEYPSIEKISNTFDLNLLIANSMIPHNTKNSVEKVNKFKENDEDRFSQLCNLENRLIDEVIIAMKNNDTTTLGSKMSENQKYLEEIQVSNNTLRNMINSLNEISLGSKITGAGDGGCVIALVEDENMDKVPALLPKDKEYFSAKIDTKGVVWSTIEE